MSARSSSPQPRRAASNSVATTSRRDAERAALAELDAWRASNVPDVAAPLDADDLVRLLRSLIESLGLDPAVSADFSVNTVHYYRRKDIIDPPVGRTVAARYEIRHLWQVVGARLAVVRAARLRRRARRRCTCTRCRSRAARRDGNSGDVERAAAPDASARHADGTGNAAFEHALYADAGYDLDDASADTADAAPD